jgi:hypothetical protein
VEVLIPLLIVVGVVAVAGVGVGILVARPIDRWTSRGDEPANEEPGGDDRPDA